MRLCSTVFLMCTLVVLAGCATGSVRTTRRPVASVERSTPTAAPARVARHERTPRVRVREAARRTSPGEWTLSSFTPPAAPALPTARKVARRPAPAPSARAPEPCAPVQPVVAACEPSQDDEEACPGGVCGVPSLDDCCPGGNCGIPSLSDILPKIDLNPCK